MDRVIRDHRTGEQHRFEGHADFASVSGSTGRSLYTEQGILVREGQSIPVARRYFYDWTDALRAHVRFEDGRLFHELDLSAGWCEVGHECGMDRYDGCYEIRGPQAWDLVWRATGPEKDYVMNTRYQCERLIETYLKTQDAQGGESPTTRPFGSRSLLVQEYGQGQ